MHCPGLMVTLLFQHSKPTCLMNQYALFKKKTQFFVESCFFLFSSGQNFTSALCMFLSAAPQLLHHHPTWQSPNQKFIACLSFKSPVLQPKPAQLFFASQARRAMLTPPQKGFTTSHIQIHKSHHAHSVVSILHTVI